MSVFNEDQIRQAIDSFQKSHPIDFGINVTQIDSLESLDSLKKEVDKYFEQAQKDSDIYIICEMAKQYLNGARPTYENRPRGHWKWSENGMDWGLGAWVCSECGTLNHNLPNREEDNPYFFAASHFCPCCGVMMKQD